MQPLRSRSQVHERSDLLAASARCHGGRRALLPTLAALICLVASAAVLAPGAEAAPILVTYEVEDLPDEVAGVDIWAYRYTISGFDLGDALGLSIFFDVGETFDLELMPGAPAAWDLLVFEPDLLLPADGALDALALSQPASSSGPIDVSFVWSGSGSPAAQGFVVYDESFANIAGGNTTLVPEPSTALLVLTGLAGFARVRRSAR